MLYIPHTDIQTGLALTKLKIKKVSLTPKVESVSYVHSCLRLVVLFPTSRFLAKSIREIPQPRRWRSHASIPPHTPQRQRRRLPDCPEGQRELEVALLTIRRLRGPHTDTRGTIVPFTPFVANTTRAAYASHSPRLGEPHN